MTSLSQGIPGFYQSICCFAGAKGFRPICAGFSCPAGGGSAGFPVQCHVSVGQMLEFSRSLPVDASCGRLEDGNEILARFKFRLMFIGCRKGKKEPRSSQSR
jgi:hypothetical protein